MLSSSLDTLLKVSKTTSPKTLFTYDCVTLYHKEWFIICRLSNFLYLIVVQGTVVGDDLAGEEGEADDDQEERVQGRTSDEQTGSESINIIHGSITNHHHKF